MINDTQHFNERIDQIVEIATAYLQKQGYPSSPDLYGLSFDPEYLKRLERKQDFLFPWYPFYRPETVKSIKILKPHSSISKMEHPNFTPLLIKKSKILRLSKRSKAILTFLETHNFEKSPMDIEKMTEAVWLHYQVILQAPKLKRFVNSSVSPAEASLLTLDFMTYVASSDMVLDYPDIKSGKKSREGGKKGSLGKTETTRYRDEKLFEKLTEIYKCKPMANDSALAIALEKAFNWKSECSTKKPDECSKKCTKQCSEMLGERQLRRIVKEFRNKI